MNKKNMNILIFVIGIVFLGWFLYSWLSVYNIEKPHYSVIKETGGYEIREYSSYIIAETIINDAKNRDDAVRKGFPIVAGYIFGNNVAKDKIAMTTPVNAEINSSEKIAMTAPVNTSAENKEDSYKVSFVMPSKYTLETLPTPNDSRVKLIEIPARKLAVKQFSWSNSEKVFKKQELEFLKELAKDGIETVGTINTARYNPPWTIPFMLRNEIQIEVK